MEGVLKAGVHLPVTTGMVLERLYPGHGHKKFYKVYLDLLMFQMQCPHVGGVPLMDITVLDDGSRDAEAVYSRSCQRIGYAGTQVVTVTCHRVEG